MSSAPDVVVEVDPLGKSAATVLADIDHAIDLSEADEKHVYVVDGPSYTVKPNKWNSSRLSFVVCYRIIGGLHLSPLFRTTNRNGGVTFTTVVQRPHDGQFEAHAITATKRGHEQATVAVTRNSGTVVTSYDPQFFDFGGSHATKPDPTIVAAIVQVHSGSLHEDMRALSELAARESNQSATVGTGTEGDE